MKTPLRVLILEDSEDDLELVAGLGRDARDTSIVEAIITMARRLELRVIAEGVETAQQLSLLRDLGCEGVQGYAVGRSMPPADFAQALRSPMGALGRMPPLLASPEESNLVRG
ncbi:MAG TPA: EAL domain-containing protein [Thermoanaerobaculia bacterium]|nr:EAL domain-containing protein [Thermoanaerobaculia bacterium]